MDIPVHYEHLFQTPGLGVLRGYGHIIEDAKSHAPIDLGVVPRGPDQGKSAGAFPQDGIHRGHGSPRCHEGGIKGLGREYCIHIQIAAAMLADGLHLLDIPPSMHGGDLLHRGGLRGYEIAVELFRFDLIQDGSEAFFFLWMLSRLMEKIYGVID